MEERNKRPVHTVVQYHYTMEKSRESLLSQVEEQRTVPFEDLFERCDNRVHAIFLFLSLLELIQERFLSILVGEGRNNFVVEWNEHREAQLVQIPPPPAL